jgi:hypothetical protein
MKRRCFVVSGEAWARIYALVEEDDRERPCWARLQVVHDDGAAGGRARAARAQEKAGREPAADEQQRFAGNVIQAAGAAVRATAAEELVLVAPPLVLAGLRAYERVLARHGIATTIVPMAIELLVPSTERPLLDGAVARSFSFASAAEALTRAARATVARAPGAWRARGRGRPHSGTFGRVRARSLRRRRGARARGWSRAAPWRRSRAAAPACRSRTGRTGQRTARA